MAVRTYLDRGSWDIRVDHPGDNTWRRIATYIGRRETVLTVDPARPGVLVLFALQANCSVSNGVVNLPYGIIVPKSAESTPLYRHYVTAYGTVNGTRTLLTVTGVNESAGTITVAENVDANTTVDVYCIPRATPILAEMRIEAPSMGVTVQRAFYVADLTTQAEREFWKSGSTILFPSAYPLPEDWHLTLWVRCSLPIRWTDSGTGQAIEHRIVIPVVIEHARGLQKSLKESLFSELVGS